jgi:hypothetical protein
MGNKTTTYVLNSSPITSRLNKEIGGDFEKTPSQKNPLQHQWIA